MTEDLIQEIEEEEYKPCNIIDGFNIVIEQFSVNSELELTLRET